MSKRRAADAGTERRAGEQLQASERNPYAPPSADAQAEREPASDVRVPLSDQQRQRIRSARFWLNFCVFPALTVYIFSKNPALWLLAMLVTLPFILYAAHRLARALGATRGAELFYLGLMLVPVLNLLCVFMLGRMATAALNRPSA